ncbi:hypothetical protein [Methylobacterium radiodurans]|uniref:Uncharacterized protein n=1 Tax=Methylobacterium radiodurans TaxID=2202828 RepID=A0A2U8VQ66_9HYPH|nr:hypothetical protein [Methylobacterium radiodurans]AWN35765.1 hypothetical protein DK427_08410 [Methylobacterium radiodurans]
MARIRTIKPEFWTSEQVMECSTNARLLFIGLWNFCDDAGRMPASDKRIKASVFPSDDFTAEDVRRMIDELSANGLILLYTVEGKEYLQVTGWRHQKIDRPQTSKIPEPPTDPDPHSPNDRRTFGVGKEGNGRERKGKESSPAPAEPHPARTLQAAPAPAPSAVAEPAAPGRAEAWANRENFDRIERRCRESLTGGGPQDLRIGPMAKLVADGLDLEAEVIPTLLDVAASARVPIRTWTIYADRIAERVSAQRQARASQGLPAVPTAPTPPEDLVDLSPHGRYPETVLRLAIAKFRQSGSWIDSVFGPAPGELGCKVPPRLLIGEAA